MRKQKNKDNTQASGEAQEAIASRDEELAEETQCCLAAIDDALGEDEEDTARREFHEIAGEFDAAWDAEDWEKAREAADDKLWQARYAHLGLEVGFCCGVPHLVDGK